MQRCASVAEDNHVGLATGLVAADGIARAEVHILNEEIGHVARAEVARADESTEAVHLSRNVVTAGFNLETTVCELVVQEVGNMKTERLHSLFGAAVDDGGQPTAIVSGRHGKTPSTQEFSEFS